MIQTAKIANQKQKFVRHTTFNCRSVNMLDSIKWKNQTANIFYRIVRDVYVEQVEPDGSVQVKVVPLKTEFQRMRL